MNLTSLTSHRYFPWVIMGLSVLFLFSPTNKPSKNERINLSSFSQLPILDGGRLKPIDTLARNTLLLLSGKQQIKSGKTNDRVTAVEWLAKLLFQPTETFQDPVFEIDDPNVLGFLDIKPGMKRLFTFTQIHPFLGDIEQQANVASEIKSQDRTRFQSALLNLFDKLALYIRLPNAITSAGDSDQISIHSDLLMQLSHAYHTNDAFTFEKLSKDYLDALKARAPKAYYLIRAEFLFNTFAPFYKSMIFYVIVFLLVSFSWLGWTGPLNRTAYTMLLFAFAVHTIGLVSRIIIQGRPPVTNLYSSAVFVGWSAVLLSIILERRYRNGIGLVAASLIGFSTLIIAHHLALQGDTLEMMRAVLDSNFWLATHVVTITIGYSSTFLSGLLGIIYLIRRVWDKNWTNEKADVLSNMVFGVVCFSTFFSFLGTILGGIWADQSWGRFWGWDPKENGALMIVLWNAIILHARWGAVVKQKGFMVLAVFGNIITSLSWFGVNMLGIGLHSYGFMNKAFTWLMIFILSQLSIMTFGWLERKK